MTREIKGENLPWWRFSDYKIEDGTIAPVSGAKAIPCNPWQERQRADSKSQRERRADITGDPPLDLLRMTLKLATFFPEFSSGAPVVLSDDQSEAITRFVQRYGLLGIFHQIVPQVAEPDLGRVWIRPRGQWLVADQAMYSDAASCLSFNLVGGIVLEPLTIAELGNDFFLPTMPAPLPNPSSAEFFRHYREPLRHFLLALHLFYGAFTEALANEWDLLNQIIEQASFRNYGTDGVPCYSSLMVSLADMLARDIEAGFWFRPCRECADLLRTKNRRALYCSRHCQWNATQKAHRRKGGTK